MRRWTTRPSLVRAWVVLRAGEKRRRCFVCVEMVGAVVVVVVVVVGDRQGVSLVCVVCACVRVCVRAAMSGSQRQEERLAESTRGRAPWTRRLAGGSESVKQRPPPC